MKISNIYNSFFLIGVFLLQFYIFRSGSLQPSHIFFILSFLIIVLHKGFNKLVILNSTYLRFVLFVFLTLLINSFYFIIYKDFDYLISSSYYIFGLIITYLTVIFLIKSEKSKTYLIFFLLFSLLLLIIFWLAGLGNYEFFPRYNGFFNDPNQMAHWALCVVAIIIILNKNTIFINYISILLTALIVLLSLSRSGLSGMFIIICAYFFPSKKNISKLLIVIFIISILVLLLNFTENNVFENYQNLITRFLETDFQEQADTRGYGRAINYPEYLIFGSGQAQDFRFKSDFEIHSSWMGILFYYGIFTLILILYNLYKLFTKLGIKVVFVVIGPMIYGFSTFGVRTPVFWLLMGVLIFNYIITIKKNVEIKKN